MTENALELRQIEKSFSGVNALHSISLDIPKGHVLGLIGQNGAGKSTLMNIIGGVLQSDDGTMLLNGQSYAPRSPADATRRGIAFIHQELNLFTNLTIAENIFIDHFPKQGIGPLQSIDRSAIRQRTHELLAQVDLTLAPDTSVEHLSPGERQLVEIARALRLDASLIIFDEPTTSLTARETHKLFETINRLRTSKTMIYISHILSDVLMLADDIAVLRNGELVASGTKGEFDTNRMITLMIGRSIDQLYPVRATTSTQQPVLEVKQLSEPGIVKNINLTLFKGEVLGLFGLMGSGRTELARILFGMDNFTIGEISVHGTSIGTRSPSTSIRNHMAFVTEKRREEGLMMNLPVAENITLVSLQQFAATPLQIVDQGRMFAAAEQTKTALKIKSGAIDRDKAMSLSGGNQQKVVLAKWLMSAPSIFILDEPTRGIDVEAKYEIYSIINNLAAQGASLLFISSELEELIGICDRILVMSRGEITSEFQRNEFDSEKILRAAFREGSDFNEE